MHSYRKHALAGEFWLIFQYLIPCEHDFSVFTCTVNISCKLLVQSGCNNVVFGYLKKTTFSFTLLLKKNPTN